MIGEALTLSASDWIALAAALGVGGLAQKAYVSFRDRRKMDAGVVSILTTSTVTLLAPLQERLESEQVDHAKCRQERGALERKNRQLTSDNFMLRQQLTDARSRLEERRRAPGPGRASDLNVEDEEPD